MLSALQCAPEFPHHPCSLQQSLLEIQPALLKSAPHRQSARPACEQAGGTTEEGVGAGTGAGAGGVGLGPGPGPGPGGDVE